MQVDGDSLLLEALLSGSPRVSAHTPCSIVYFVEALLSQLKGVSHRFTFTVAFNDELLAAWEPRALALRQLLAAHLHQAGVPVRHFGSWAGLAERLTREKPTFLLLTDAFASHPEEAKAGARGNGLRRS